MVLNYEDLSGLTNTTTVNEPSKALFTRKLSLRGKGRAGGGGPYLVAPDRIYRESRVQTLMKFWR